MWRDAGPAAGCMDGLAAAPHAGAGACRSIGNPYNGHCVKAQASPIPEDTRAAMGTGILVVSKMPQ